MDAYLDNVVVSRLVRGQLETEQDAAERLLEMYEAGEIQLCTSRVAKDEIDRTPNEETRKAAEAMRRRVLALPEVPEILYLQPLSGRKPATGLVEDPRRAQLRSIVKDFDDARHLHHAIGNGVPYFVTRDRGILHHKTHLLADFSVTVLRPSELLEIVESQTS